MNIFTADYLNDLTLQASTSPRLRHHRNIHHDFNEPCQRLFNAIEPDSYIRPHRHAAVPRNELLIAIRGLMALVTFDNQGQIKQIVHFGSEKYGSNLATGAEVSSDIWHTVVALVPASILLEVKAGPFDPCQPKEFASWAPEEGSEQVQFFVEQLHLKISKRSFPIKRQFAPP